MPRTKRDHPAYPKPTHTLTRYQFAIRELGRVERGEKNYSAPYVAALRRIVERGA